MKYYLSLLGGRLGHPLDLVLGDSCTAAGPLRCSEHIVGNHCGAGEGALAACRLLLVLLFCVSVKLSY